jgi:hypothetical protein
VRLDAAGGCAAQQDHGPAGGALGRGWWLAIGGWWLVSVQKLAGQWGRPSFSVACQLGHHADYKQ